MTTSRKIGWTQKYLYPAQKHIYITTILSGKPGVVLWLAAVTNVCCGQSLFGIVSSWIGDHRPPEFLVTNPDSHTVLKYYNTCFSKPTVTSPHINLKFPKKMLMVIVAHA